MWAAHSGLPSRPGFQGAPRHPAAPSDAVHTEVPEAVQGQPMSPGAIVQALLQLDGPSSGSCVVGGLTCSALLTVSFLTGALAGRGVPGPADAGHHGTDDPGGPQELSPVSEARNGGKF